MQQIYLKPSQIQQIREELWNREPRPEWMRSLNDIDWVQFIQDQYQGCVYVDHDLARYRVDFLNPCQATLFLLKYS